MAVNNEKEKGKNEGKKNAGFMDKKNGRKRAHCPIYWPKEMKKHRNLEVILIYFVCVCPLFFFPVRGSFSLSEHRLFICHGDGHREVLQEHYCM